jgi:hypothetical protein
MIEIVPTSGYNLISVSLGMALITLRSVFGNSFSEEYTNGNKI